MWLFTKEGFVSIVANRDEPGLYLARARISGHLGLVFRGKEETHTPVADYPYRVIIDEAELIAALMRASMELDYFNFKGAIEDEEYHRLALRVWASARTPEVIDREGDWLTDKINDEEKECQD